MNLKTYQTKALSTALPTAFSLDYVVPAIYGEWGEVIEKRGKAQRDDWSAERFAVESAKELGDVAWATAVLLHMAGIDRPYAPTPREREAVFRSPGLFKKRRLEISKRVLVIYEAYTYGDTTAHLGEMAHCLWWHLQAYSLELCSHTWDQVLQMNVDKLASRKARGVITGAGDNR